MAVLGQAVQVVVYKNAKQYQRDVEKRIKHGWMQQSAVVEERHINWVRTAGKALTLGIIFGGPSRSGGSVTVTWVHS